MRKFLKKHPNLNLLISGVALVYIWRGVWSLTDMFTIGEFDIAHFWSYSIPMVLAFLYIYMNDSKLTELVHIKD